jgi:hypothetical protein
VQGTQPAAYAKVAGCRGVSTAVQCCRGTWRDAGQCSTVGGSGQGPGEHARRSAGHSGCSAYEVAGQFRHNEGRRHYRMPAAAGQGGWGRPSDCGQNVRTNGSSGHGPGACEAGRNAIKLQRTRKSQAGSGTTKVVGYRAPAPAGQGGEERPSDCKAECTGNVRLVLDPRLECVAHGWVNGTVISGLNSGGAGLPPPRTALHTRFQRVHIQNRGSLPAPANAASGQRSQRQHTGPVLADTRQPAGASREGLHNTACGSNSAQKWLLKIRSGRGTQRM